MVKIWKEIINILEKLRAEFDEGSRLLSRLQTYQRMQHEVRPRSKFVVKGIFNVTQGHKRGDQQNFKSRSVKKVSMKI